MRIPAVFRIHAVSCGVRSRDAETAGKGNTAGFKRNLAAESRKRKMQYVDKDDLLRETSVAVDDK